MDGFEYLKTIPIETISEKTHIRINVIRDIMEKNFVAINNVKARGFITIIEKEFDVDLSEWINEYASFCNEKTAVSSIYDDLLKDNPKTTPQNYKAIALFLLAISVGSGLWYYATTFSPSQLQPNSTEPNVSLASTPTSLENNMSGQDNMTLPFVENSQTNSTNAPSSNNATASALTKSSPLSLPFSIIPTKPIWFKITYLDTNETENHEVTTEWTFKPRLQVIRIDKGQYSMKGAFGTVDLNTPTSQKFLFINNTLLKITNEDYDAIKAGTLKPDAVKGI